jgi:hypothetical protein
MKTINTTNITMSVNSIAPVEVNMSELWKQFEDCHPHWSESDFCSYGWSGYGFPNLPTFERFEDACVLMCTEEQFEEIVDRHITSFGTAYGPWGEHDVDLVDLDEIFVFVPDGKSYSVTDGFRPRTSEYNIREDVSEALGKAAKNGDWEAVCKILDEESWRGGIQLSPIEWNDGSLSVLGGNTYSDICEMSSDGSEYETVAVLMHEFECMSVSDGYDCGTDFVPAIVVHSDGVVETNVLVDEELVLHPINGVELCYQNYIGI